MGKRIGPAVLVASLAALLAGDLTLRARARVQPESTDRPHSFALVIGDCIWKPPSAAAALGAVAYFFGVGSTAGTSYVENFHLALAHQYVASGQTRERAEQEVANFDRCVASYVPEQQ